MLKRFIESELNSHLRIFPVVLLIGARQSGKTTLLESMAKRLGYTYITFDDELTLANALRDPSGWLASMPKPLVIDEVQRVPEIFLSIKLDVDKKRETGRYLLSGSANPLLLPRLGDSLAGRMGIVNMFPLSRDEIRQSKAHFIEFLFQKDFSTPTFEQLNKNDFIQWLLWGGFPVLQSFDQLADVRRWIRSYLQTMMERDIRDLSNIEGLRELPRLFRLLSTRSGMLLNMADLSRGLGMVNVTLNRYLRLLETLFFIYLLPAWFSNHGKRIIKSPKLHLCDTAILGHLLEVDEMQLREDPIRLGQFVENYVFSELLKQKSWSSIPFELYHFRDGNYEVDLVLERQDGSIVGIEVKSAKMLHKDDLRGLKHLQSLAKDSFQKGVILHFGHQSERLDDQLWSLPIQSLWQPSNPP